MDKKIRQILDLAMRSTLKDVAPPKCVRNGIVKPINKTKEI